MGFPSPPASYIPTKRKNIYGGAWESNKASNWCHGEPSHTSLLLPHFEIFPSTSRDWGVCSTRQQTPPAPPDESARYGEPKTSYVQGTYIDPSTIILRLYVYFPCSCAPLTEAATGKLRCTIFLVI